MKTKALFNRHKVLVALLGKLGGTASNLDFQKLLFLYCLDYESIPSYEFIPYRYGAFSFTSYADRRKLVAQGLLADLSDYWELSETGAVVALEHEAQLKNVSGFLSRYRNMRGNRLVAETYRRYPYYGIQSQIAGKVLHGDALALQKIDAARPPKNNPGIVTIGYEGRSLEAYLNLLIRDGVTLLCDVRRNALSRKYGFSKRTLSRACEGVGIRYEHMPDLGIDSGQRKNLSSDGSYERLFDRYRRDVIPVQTGRLETIAGWVENGERVALTCFERHHQQCHRHCVSEELERHGTPFKATHL